MPLDQRSTFRIENIVNPAIVFGTVWVYFLIKGGGGGGFPHRSGK